jgi:hypothetical protein
MSHDLTTQWKFGQVSARLYVDNHPRENDVEKPLGAVTDGLVVPVEPFQGFVRRVTLNRHLISILFKLQGTAARLARNRSRPSMVLYREGREGYRMLFEFPQFFA